MASPQATGVAGNLVGGQAGQAISSIGQTVGNVLPFSTIPSGAGPQGQAAKPGDVGDLIAVPAGLWGWLVSQATGVAGNLVGGQAARPSAASARPSATSCPSRPSRAAPGTERQAAKPGDVGDLIAVPAGLWGWLVSQATGVAGNLIGGQARPGHQQHRPDRRQRPALLDHPERRRCVSCPTEGNASDDGTHSGDSATGRSASRVALPVRQGERRVASCFAAGGLVSTGSSTAVWAE